MLSFLLLVLACGGPAELDKPNPPPTPWPTIKTAEMAAAEHQAEANHQVSEEAQAVAPTDSTTEAETVPTEQTPAQPTGTASQPEVQAAPAPAQPTPDEGNPTP